LAKIEGKITVTIEQCAEEGTMRIYPDEATLPPGMIGAWHSDAHMTIPPARLSPERLVAAVFNLEPRPLLPGDSVKTIAGKFQVESVREDGDLCQIVLLTGAPGLQARLGMTALQREAGEWSVVLYNSVHPYSWAGCVYFRLVEPFHHLLVERVLLARLRKQARVDVT
jgi:hypothetical protein